jgi:hypothetical protein
MSTYQQRGYIVEVGFAVGHLPEGPVDPDSFRPSRQEVEALLREIEEFEQEADEFGFEFGEDPEDRPFPGDVRLPDEAPPRRGIVPSVRVSGRRITQPRVMSQREWKILLAERIY